MKLPFSSWKYFGVALDSVSVVNEQHLIALCLERISDLLQSGKAPSPIYTAVDIAGEENNYIAGNLFFSSQSCLPDFILV